MSDGEAGRKPFVFEIPEHNFEKLVERLKKMVGRSRKCKRPPPRFEVIHEADWEVEDRSGSSASDFYGDIEGDYGAVPSSRSLSFAGMAKPKRMKWVHYYYVTVEGERPHIAGWDFIATIDHTEQGADGVGNVIKSVPGVGEIPVDYRSALPICHHCNTARRRLETFVVRNATGVTRQIGRNCLQDFFPGRSPEDVAAQLEWWVEACDLAEGAEDEDFFGGGGGGGRYTRLPLETVLGVTQLVIECEGWLSRTKAKEMFGVHATADLVESLFFPPRPVTQSFLKFEAKVDAKQAERGEAITSMVEAAIEWVRSLSPTESEDYLYNLWVICRGETVRVDRLGLACSLMAAHRRHLDGERRKTEAAERPPSDYVGEIKKRAIFANCIVKHIGEPRGNDFGGTSQRVLFLKDGKDVVLWYATNGGANTLTVGEAYNIVGTPTRHEEKFNAYSKAMEKQTVINRVGMATEHDLKKYGPKEPKRKKTEAR